MAVAPDGGVYHIDRLGADGRVLGTITRDIPRVRRTPEELDAMAQTARRAADRAGAERGRSNVPPPILPRPGGGADFKPHIATNGLRYDGAGRLWVRTMRGDATSTVFDVFTPAGAFLGEVKVDAAVSAYAFGGRWMAAAIVTEEGYAIVRVFEVR
jgi:hypothetical protein